MSPHIDPVVKFAEPMEDDDEVTRTEIILGRPLTKAEIKREPNENDDDLVIIKEIRGKTKKMKEESSENEFVSYNGKLLLQFLSTIIYVISTRLFGGVYIIAGFIFVNFSSIPKIFFPKIS